MRAVPPRQRFFLCLALILSSGAAGWHALGAETPAPAAATLKYEEPKLLTGAIYSRDSHQLLYRFKRVANRSGSTLKVTRDFTYPDGKLAARERVIYEGDSLVSYELDETQIGASGSATIRRSVDNPAKDTIEFEYSQEAGSRSKGRTEPLRQNTLTADMVGPFLSSHWAALQRGERVRCRYIVVPRRETVGFTFVKDSDSAAPGQNVLIVRMEPTSRFVAVLVDPLFFTIEQTPPHRVLQYVGRTTPKIQAGSKWQDLDAVTIFDWATSQY